MSETEEKHEIILPDAIVSIKISTGFYQKLQGVLGAITKGKSKTELNDAYTKIKAQKIDPEKDEDVWIQQLETMFILLKEFQQEAKKAGFVTQMTQSEVKEYIKEKFPETSDKLDKIDKDIQVKKDLNVSVDMEIVKKSDKKD